MELVQDNPQEETKTEKTERELKEFNEQLEAHFGQNIFTISQEALKELVDSKGLPDTDLLSIRLTIESKIRLVERQFEKDPDDSELEQQIADLMRQDQVVDYLYKLKNA